MSETDRVILVSEGASEFVMGRIEERFGEDLGTFVFSVALGSYDSPTQATDWFSAHHVEVEGPVAMVGMRVDGDTAPEPVEQGHLWVRLVDGDVTMIRRCGGGTVTVA